MGEVVPRIRESALESVPEDSGHTWGQYWRDQAARNSRTTTSSNQLVARNFLHMLFSKQEKIDQAFSES